MMGRQRPAVQNEATKRHLWATIAATSPPLPETAVLNRAERRRQLKEQKKAAKQGGAGAAEGAAALYDEGNRLGALGKLAEAEAAYRQAIAARPQFPEALSNLGSVFQATGRPA